MGFTTLDRADELRVYLFSSKNLTNIWAGTGADLWAISPATATKPVVKAAALQFRIGSFGLFYCSEIKALTTPFVVLSHPDLNGVVHDVWPDAWALPFRIHAVGSPHKVLKISDAVKLLPTLSKAPRSDWYKILHFQPMLAFQPSRLLYEDWDVIIQRLAVGALP